MSLILVMFHNDRCILRRERHDYMTINGSDEDRSDQHRPPTGKAHALSKNVSRNLYVIFPPFYGTDRNQ